MTSPLRRKPPITQLSTWAETAHRSQPGDDNQPPTYSHSHQRRSVVPAPRARALRAGNARTRSIAMVVAGTIAMALTGSAVAGGLEWQSPTKSQNAKPAPGVWSKARSSNGRSNAESAALFSKTNRLRDRRIAPVAHQEIGALDGPRFAEGPRASEVDASPRPMRSVLVNRPLEDTPEQDPFVADTRLPQGARRVAARQTPADRASNWQRAPENRVSRRHRISQQPRRDPFEDEDRTPEPESRTPDPRNETAQILPEADPVEINEPRPLDNRPTADEGANNGADPFDRDRTVPPPTEGVDPLESEPFQLRDTTDSDEFDYPGERERVEKDCAEQTQRLKEVISLSPWKDTTKDGWQERSGDEIRDLLNIRMDGTEGDDYPYECALHGGTFEPRAWSGITYLWKASALCHKPLYFEDVHLERYGHSWGPFAQPLISGAHFFVSVPLLPYKMGLKMPNECVYSLGHYRPGNCAPYLIDPIPFTWRAAVLQAGAVVGAAAVLP